MKRIWPGLACMCLMQLSSYAQPSSILQKNIHFEQLPADLGLSERAINCILQDHQGYLWIGTWSGLIKYDGYTTTIFRADNREPDQLKSNKIVRLYESRDSTLWVATRSGGLFRKDKHRDIFEAFTYEPGCSNCLSSQHVWDVTEDPAGGLWIATENGLNYRDPDGQFHAYFTNPMDTNTLSNNFITRLVWDASGHLWAATEYGVNRMINSDPLHPDFQRIIYNEDWANRGLHNYVYDMEVVENAHESVVCWVSKKGLKKYSPEGLQNYEITDRSAPFNVFRCLRLISGTAPFLLIGSDMGLHVFDLKKNAFIRFFGDFSREVNLSQNTITALAVDRGGVVWAGTKRGLNKYDSYDNNIGLYPTRSFDPSGSIITGVCQSSDQEIWLSTLGGGLFRLLFQHGVVRDIQKYKVENREGLDFSDYIQKLTIDSRGQFWLGMAGAGVYVFNGKDLDEQRHLIRTYRHYHMNSQVPLSDDYIMAFCESVNGDMWVGTWSKGLNLVKENGEVIIFDDPRLTPSALVCLYEDPEGYLWVGTRGEGIFRLKIKNRVITEFVTYHYSDEQSGLSSNFVNTFFRDRKDRLWVGTEEGLSRYDAAEDRFLLINLEQERLPNDVVGICQDESGKLWLAGDEGITVIDPDQETYFVNHFDTKDRVQGGFFYNEVALLTEDGDHLIMGGANGFNVIDPQSICQNPLIPQVVIKEIRIADQEVDPLRKGGAQGAGLGVDELTMLKLGYHENSIAFEFAGLHYANPAKNRYAYKLEGFDNDWQYTGASRRFAKYTNLNPGTYYFTVKASNDDGLWNTTGKTIKVVITPPWWRTPWAIAAYVGLGMILLMLFRKMILVRSAYEHDLKLERMKRENTDQLNKSRLQFFTNISHEFRTPLTLILGMLEELTASGEGGLKVQRQLKLISQSAGRLQRLISQLLDFRKVEAGSLKLRVAEGNFYKFVKELKLSFDNLAKRKGIHYELISSSNVISLYFDRDQFEKILSNLLSNAFKHTASGGRISVRLQEFDSYVSLAVADSGDGIAPQDLQRVFDRFYSGEKDPGTGIGLALCKSLVELHHGQIAVTSSPDQGATFEVMIRKGCAHFSSSDLIENFLDSERIEGYREETDENIWGEAGDQARQPQAVTKLKRLLIVEDNPDVRSFLRTVFQYEYAVFEAEHGGQGLELAEEIDPDLIISDVMMPVMDGITLCEKIKENLNTSHIPVILLTARTSFVYTVEGLEKGADDYVTKPFQVRVLRLKVRNLIRTHDQMRSMAQDNTPLMLEPRAVTVTSTDERFLQHCLDELEKQISDSDYTVVHLGKAVGLSRMQLYRKLKALTGKSPNEFIRMIRVKRAAQLFEQGDLNISEVTYKVGFSDPAYFRKCFRDQFGINPSDYVRKAGKVSSSAS